jgi:hypothetical protein
MRKWILVVMMICLVWIITFKDGSTTRARALVGSQWASSGTIFGYIEMDGRKTYIQWSDVKSVTEESWRTPVSGPTHDPLSIR